MPDKNRISPDDLRGVSRLAIDATLGITDLVEALHHNIVGHSGPVPLAQSGRTRGISGMVYRTIRGTTRLAGHGLDAALGLLVTPLSTFKPLPEREHLNSAVNGVLGDHLVRTENPLAIPMTVRIAGKPLALSRQQLADAMPHATGKLLLLVHGLCMNDMQWKCVRADGSHHDHGQALQQTHGYTAVYLHYNTGLAISDNGRALAELLERLVAAWPVAVEELNVLAHSMGGLVTRSAQQHACNEGHSWLASTRKVVFLGTPHHGAPLERGGHWFDLILGAAPFAAPLVKIGKIRSTGIMDLRYGGNAEKGIQLPPLPEGIECFAIAGSMGRKTAVLHGNRTGDGLVPVDSALGLHEEPGHSLEIPSGNRVTLKDVNHMQLLSDAGVYAVLETALKPDSPASPGHP